MDNPMLYFYRIHKKQDSAIRTEIGRLKLISWIKSLEINFIKKQFSYWSKITVFSIL